MLFDVHTYMTHPLDWISHGLPIEGRQGALFLRSAPLDSRAHPHLCAKMEERYAAHAGLEAHIQLQR